MTCPHCGTDAPAGAARCSACGAPRTSPLDVAGPAPDLDVTGGIPDAGAFETIGGGTPSAGTGTHQLGPDVTRVAAGPTGGRSSGGGPRQFRMLTPGETLGVRYHIIRLLGVGGMGAVYHAWDAELGVAVALKVIRGDITGDPDATAAIERQFKRELLLARQVTHKHVVRIHDLNEIDGIKYITMPYVQGADLASMLKESGTLPIPRTLRYIKQIVGGLVAAHEAGVVHRDLKPANIMIDEDDQALIMDFGIAHSSSATGAAAETVVGTLAYMAPEQAQAKPTDQRADVYALGMMLREMLVGRKPTSDGKQALADLMERIKEPPPRLRTIAETIPEPLDTLAARCVEPDPANRFQSSAELAAALAALDDQGELIPIPPRFGKRLIVASAVAVLSLITGTWWLARTPVQKQHAPVSVLIADFDNRSGDPAFQNSLEQALAIGVEGASFITAYPRDAARRLAATQVGPAAKLDESVARLLSGREGINVILAGAIEPRGSGYSISVRAVDPANGKTLATTTASSPDKAGVLKAAGTVASRMRTALGDTTPESAKRAAIETFTAASLEAAQDFSSGQELASSGKDEEAIAYYKRALDKDPRFGRAYTSWAVSAFKLGRRDESAEAYKKAMALTDRMTDREKYRTFGVYYLQVARNYPKALENYTALVQAYPNDRAGHSNLALAHFYLRNFPKALEEGRLAVEQYPNLQTFRNNYALYAMYAGDFAAAAKEAQRTLQENPTFSKAYLEVAVATLAAGDIAAATEAYDKMAQGAGAGASLAAIGKADIALYTGRSADARQILEAAIPADKAAKNVYGVAMKYVALAEAFAAQGNSKASLEAAQQAVTVSRDVNVAAAAALVMVTAGRIPEAKAIVDRLGQELEAEPRAYAKVIEGEIALQQRRTGDAVGAFIESQKIVDLWISRLELGRAYEEAEHHAEALAELDRATKRRGEATALFLDDIPTFRHLATLPYWLARAQEGLGMPAATDNYRAFLAVRPDQTNTPLAADALRRLSR